jgi:hypothetical protein
MKFIAYTLFVVSVLLISGLARANDLSMPFVRPSATYQTPFQIKNVSNEGQMQLAVTGTLPNPCYPQPSATLTPDANDPQTLVLRLSSPYPQQGACISKTQAPMVIQEYTVIVDLLPLIQASQVNLHPRTIYTLKTEGYEYSMQISGSDLVH